MFNSHKGLVESGEVTSDRFCIYFFLLSVTDRSEEINQYLPNVFISPIDIKQVQFDVWANITSFDSSNLDSFGLEKKINADTVMKCLEHMINISSSNLIRISDGLLSKRKEDLSVNWIGTNNDRNPPQKLKIS